MNKAKNTGYNLHFFKLVPLEKCNVLTKADFKKRFYKVYSFNAGKSQKKAYNFDNFYNDLVRYNKLIDRHKSRKSYSNSDAYDERTVLLPTLKDRLIEHINLHVTSKAGGHVEKSDLPELLCVLTRLQRNCANNYWSYGDFFAMTFIFFVGILLAFGLYAGVRED